MQKNEKCKMIKHTLLSREGAGAFSSSAAEKPIYRLSLPLTGFVTQDCKQQEAP